MERRVLQPSMMKLNKGEELIAIVTLPHFTFWISEKKEDRSV